MLLQHDGVGIPADTVGFIRELPQGSGGASGNEQRGADGEQGQYCAQAQYGPTGIARRRERECSRLLSDDHPAEAGVLEVPVSESVAREHRLAIIDDALNIQAQEALFRLNSPNLGKDRANRPTAGASLSKTN